MGARKPKDTGTTQDSPPRASLGAILERHARDEEGVRVECVDGAGQPFTVVLAGATSRRVRAAQQANAIRSAERGTIAPGNTVALAELILDGEIETLAAAVLAFEGLYADDGTPVPATVENARALFEASSDATNRCSRALFASVPFRRVA